MKKLNILLLALAVFVLTATSALAEGAIETPEPEVDDYEFAVYGAPEVSANGDTVLTIRNIHHPEVIDVAVVKIWDDMDNRDNLRPENICVTLTASANGGAATGQVFNHTLSASDVDANDDNQWKYVFEDLVKYYAGDQIAYSITESDGTCTEITYNQTSCILSGGKWNNSACTKKAAASPNTYKDAASCETAGFEWYPFSSECVSENPSDYTTQGDCELVEGYWYNNQ